MENIDIKQQILPLFLLVVVLLQIELSLQNIILAAFPLIMISAAIHLKNKILGIIGIALFYIVSISQISISSIDDFLVLTLEILLLFIPSVLLLNQILQMENEEIFYIPKDKKPILISLAILITIVILFYILATISWDAFLLSSESIGGQILLLSGITVVICTPFLLSKK